MENFSLSLSCIVHVLGMGVDGRKFKHFMVLYHLTVIGSCLNKSLFALPNTIQILIHVRKFCPGHGEHITRKFCTKRYKFACRRTVLSDCYWTKHGWKELLHSSSCTYSNHGSGNVFMACIYFGAVIAPVHLQPFF